MNYYFKIIPYLFLVAAAIFLYDGIMNVIDGKDPYLSFIFVGIGVFMFFFRKRSYKRFLERHKENQ